MPKRAFAAALAVMIVLAELSFSSQGSREGDYFQVREKTIELYAAASASDLADYLERCRRSYRDTEQTYFLRRAAALAHLAGDGAIEEKRLIGVLQSDEETPRFLLYVIEFLRARGTLDDHIDDVLARVRELDRRDGLDAASALAFAYAWRQPPEKVISLVTRAAADDPTPDRLAGFARALAAWGYRRDAEKLLSEAAIAAGKDLRTVAYFVGALGSIDARDAAREVAASAFQGHKLRAVSSATPLGDAWTQRRARLSRLGDMAAAASAWDRLLETVASAARPDWRAFDRAAVFEAGGFHVESAEALADFRSSRVGFDSDALYAGALVRSGDAWSARAKLLPIVALGPLAPADVQYDLADCLDMLRDYRTMESFAMLGAIGDLAPQQARTMSDWLRARGKYEAADGLFRVFVEKTGMGDESRFAWQGKRLWAIHFLDTGRVEKGVSAAEEAIRLLVAETRLRNNRRSPEPKKFVALFERVARVDYLADFAARKRVEFPDAILLARIEKEALEKLGRWDEAIKLDAEINQDADEVERALFAASANARAGRWEEAAEAYEKAIGSDARVPSAAHFKYAEASAQLERWHDVERSFARMIPNNQAAQAVELGAFLSARGRIESARRVWARLDDLSIEVTARQLAAALRFWVDNALYDEAADALARRLGLQNSRMAKVAFIKEAMPRSHRQAVGFLALGEKLEEGPLGSDAALLAHLYRRLGSIFERTLDPALALVAYRRAARIQPGSPAAFLAIARLGSFGDPDRALEASAEAGSRLPVTSGLVDRVVREIVSGQLDAARQGLRELAGKALSTAEATLLVDALERSAVALTDASQLAEGANYWPWILRARLAEAVGGDDEEFVERVRAISQEGSHVTRALWAARALLRRRRYDEAADVLAAHARGQGAHPAAELLAAEIAAQAGLHDRQVSLLVEGALRAGIAGIRKLFERELVRAGAGRDEPQSRGGGL